MKNLAVLILCASAAVCLAGRAQAQPRSGNERPQAPILPLEIKFRHVNQYFAQAIEGDSRYSRIEVVFASDGSEIILTDRTMNRRAFYSGSPNRVDVLRAEGADAYTAVIQIDNFPTAGMYFAYRIRFQDTYGQEIDWRFFTQQIVAHADPEVMAEPNDLGFAVIYAPRRASPAAGTVVTIKGREHAALASASGGAYKGWYAEDLTIAQIVSGTELLAIQASPSNLTEGAQWNLKGPAGESTVVVKSVSEGKLEMEQTSPDGQNAQLLSYRLETNNDGYYLKSVSVLAHGNTLWLFFDPGLPLPSNQEAHASDIAFNIAENEQATIASGKLTVHKYPGVERIVWQFDTPDSARSSTFESAVNILPESAVGDGKKAICPAAGCRNVSDDPQ
jgi:hypothetical protein